MGNCVCGLFNCVTGTLAGIIRCLLFIFCVLLTLGTVLDLWGLYTLENNVVGLELPGVEHFIGLQQYLLRGAALLIAIIGVHGTWTKDPRYLKLFALCISIYAVIHFFMVADRFSNTDWMQQKKAFDKKMIKYAQEFEYDLPYGQEGNKGTRAWNLIQRNMLCCGLTGPKDWADGPLHEGGDRLPQSCCLNTPRTAHMETCTLSSSNKYPAGCDERVELLFMTDTCLVFIQTLLYMLFAIFALILARKPDPAPGVIYSSAAGGPVYERFGGSVYVRSNPAAPASARAHPSATGFAKQPPTAPSQMYPSIDLPPPQYTSS